MQGEGQDKAQNKDLEYIEKDNMPYGTYIEVQGYYRSVNAERVEPALSYTGSCWVKTSRQTTTRNATIIIN